MIDRSSDVGNLTSLRKRVGISAKLKTSLFYLGVVGKGWSIVRSRYQILRQLHHKHAAASGVAGARIDMS